MYILYIFYGNFTIIGVNQNIQDIKLISGE